MVTINDGILKIAGKIDSSNAPRFEQELFSLYKEGPAVIDIAELVYISSAGLRVLMKLRKRTDSVTLLNASSEVYDILQITGFTEMLTVKKAMRFVSTEGLELIGKGAHGKVYKLTDDMIIKTYHDGCSLETIEKEQSFGKNAFVQGVPCAIAFDVVRCETGYGVIFEMAGGTTLSSYITQHPEKLKECSVKYAELLKQIHSLPANPKLYGNIKDLFWSRALSASEFFTSEETESLKRMFDAISDRDTMVHGDCHPGNVMINTDGELLIIDMADIGYGNPIYDIGGLFLSMIIPGKSDPELVKSIIGMDFEKCSELWNIALSVYYNTSDPDTLKLINQRCFAFALLRMATNLNNNTEHSRQKLQGMIAMLRQNLFPNEESFIRLLSAEF